MLHMTDFYAGVGGASCAGDSLGIPTTHFIEIDPDAQSVLRSHFPSVPIHDDIRTYTPTPQTDELQWHSFPCTGTSNAGSRTGLTHPASALWRESLRCIIQGKPKFVVIEQPEGFIRRGLRTVLAALRMAGHSYDCPQLISAKELGAMHERKRLFIVSYSNEWIQNREIPCCWSDQVRDVVQETRDSSKWLSIERTCNGEVDGISGGLVQSDLSVVSGYKGRIRARYLAGRTVCPLQAEIPLKRVLYLDNLLKEN